VINQHRLPSSLFEAIAEGGGGAEAMRELAVMQRSKHMLMLRGVFAEARAADHDQWMLASRGYDLLANAQGHDPAAADAVITYSSVGAWAKRTLQGLLRDEVLPGAEPGVMCAVAAAAAIRARLPAQIEVPVRRGTVTLPSLGVAAVDGDHAVVRSTATAAHVDSAGGRVEIPSDPHQDARGWTGLRRLRAGSFDLLVDDLDPFRMPAVPDLAPRLCAVHADTLSATFRQAWQLLDRHHPVVAAEASTVVKVIVPRRVPASGVVSSSSPETFGAIAMSLPTDGCALAETLAHEVQHVKLSALSDAVRLTKPDDGSRFYAPWREDPRPADALLQGAYAYLGVTGFWLRQRRQEGGAARVRADAEYERWRTATALATGMLRSSGALTRQGTEFVRGMRRTLRRWTGEPVSEQARLLARQEAERHRQRWEAANGPIPT
jgi:uncharacterized protein